MDAVNNISERYVRSKRTNKIWSLSKINQPINMQLISTPVLKTFWTFDKAKNVFIENKKHGRWRYIVKHIPAQKTSKRKAKLFIRKFLQN